MKTKRVGSGVVIIILFIACITFGVACTQRTDTTGQNNSSTTAVNTEEATEESIQVTEETETVTETESSYNDATDPVSDVMTDEWFRTHSLVGIDESDINKEDVEISDKLADDYVLPDHKMVSLGISSDNFSNKTMLITCMNYINDFVSNRDFESVRIAGVSMSLDDICVVMQLDGEVYDFYCLTLDSTKEGCFTVYTVNKSAVNGSQEYADESVESTELKTDTETQNLYNGPIEQVPDVMTDEWFRAHSLAGIDESNINKEDVEISDKLADDYELPDNEEVSSGISYGNTMLITCMNYINDFVSSRDFESVRISALSITADGTCVQMQLGDGYYDFYCLPLDSTKEGCFTMYTVYKGDILR